MSCMIAFDPRCFDANGTILNDVGNIEKYKQLQNTTAKETVCIFVALTLHNIIKIHHNDIT